ncbi:MAG: biopolymer transporter ExbB [Candidatus Liberibacter ctenarytainae]|uniref:Biopolymer transporter ExbB n=1 Tax=Candidatus Liberibacter ctenarytainae TaxID=2020335 RepID=A0A937ACZ7_9HYPH|nr:biopolymer transporter ExbB [Candidatus Liberibacter ctenarytainae]
MNNIGVSVMDVNIFSFFMHTGWMMKCIIILLCVFSFWTWGIIIQKSLNFVVMRRQFRDFEQLFWSGQSLEALCQLFKNRQNSGLSAIFMSAMCEWKKSFEKGVRSTSGVQDRIDRMMNVTIARELEKIMERLDTLATLSSIGVLVGLVGTVLGIMSALHDIAGTQFTGAAAIFAPGIIESLISTLLGLCVTIPASIAYNKFMGDSKKFSVTMEGFANELFSILSRQIEGNMT